MLPCSTRYPRTVIDRADRTDLECFSVKCLRCTTSRNALTLESCSSWVRPAHSDVVEVGECVFQLLLLDDFVHKSLKHRNTIGHTKWYATELVQLSTRFKCSIFPLCLRYTLLLVTSGSSAASSWQPGHHKVSSI